MAKADHLVDIDRVTGEYVQGWARIKQSLTTILTTRLKTRLMRLWWGCDLLNIQDKPANQEVLMDGIMAAVSAINTYEPEFKVKRVTLANLDATGSMTVIAEGIDLIDQANRRVETPL